MKKHHASRLHYDLRLEWDGGLLSWALPQGPSRQATVIRQAIEMESHRKAYLGFEGEHETGTIMLWDRGTWEPYPTSADVGENLHKGILRFTLHGEKLKGGWILTRITTESVWHPTWTLCKCDDPFAQSQTNKCILEEMPNSIKTGRTMGEIRRDWSSPKDRYQHQMKLFDAT
ncbi:MAG TPA: DNA polymerase ligase N-terminal domain-containing protein [Terriglobales bacterium]|nr:DNA polymerase ligase N-terminal domain-containing protein [Terriglobales bacterium]